MTESQLHAIHARVAAERALYCQRVNMGDKTARVLLREDGSAVVPRGFTRCAKRTAQTPGQGPARLEAFRRRQMGY